MKFSLEYRVAQVPHQWGGAVVRGSLPPFKICAPPFHVWRPVAAYIQCCIYKCGPSCSFSSSAAKSWRRAWRCGTHRSSCGTPF